MPTLDLKIPPPVVALVIGGAMWSTTTFGPVIAAPTSLRRGLGLTLAMVGVAFSAAGAYSFRRAKTTVNPLKPATTSALVTTGVYRISRNPMYVGLLCVLTGLAAFLASPLALAGPVIAYFYLGRFQIAPEERVLTKLFGPPYTAYQRRVRRWLVVALAIAGVSVGATQRSELASILEQELRDYPATTGVFVKHLTTGEEAGVRADQDFSTASVIKLTFMLRAYQMADGGALDLDERMTLTRAHLRHGTGVFQHHDGGLQPTLRDAITQMIITSDNTATDIVLMKIGGPAAVTTWLADSGFPKIASYGRPHDYRRDLLALLDPSFATLTAEETTGLMYASDSNPLFDLYRPLFEGPRARWVDTVKDPANRQRLARERNERTSSDRTFWLGSMTPRDTARLLEGIERGTAASRSACDAMLLTLRRQQLGARRFPHFVDVPVSHKTGDGGTIANDAGIIYSRSGPIVVTFFANGVRGSYGEAEDRIGRLAERIVTYFDRPR